MRRALIALGLVAVALLVCAPAAGAHTYGGKTDGGGKIRFRVSSGFTYFMTLRATSELSCLKGNVRSFRRGEFRQFRVFVRFSGGEAFSGTSRVRPLRGSLVRRGRFSINGSASHSSARGVFRLRTVLRDGTRCRSGRVRFRAPLLTTNE